MKNPLLILVLVFTTLNISSQTYLKGYQKSIKGEELQYHSPQPDAGISLLVRSEDAKNYIEWETEPVSDKHDAGNTRFLMLAGIDVNGEDPHSWDILINGDKYFTISSPHDTLNKNLSWPGPDGSLLEFRTTEIDKYGDFMGYLTLTLNCDKFEAGNPVRIKVIGENAKSRTWFMVFKYPTEDYVKVSAENAVRNGPEGETQLLKTEVAYFGEPVLASFEVGNEKFYKELQFGYNVHYIEVPKIAIVTEIPVQVKIGEEIMTDETVSISPVKSMTIYLLHHSHVDIGYTHVQEEVEKLQWQWLEKSIELAKETKDFPVEAQFKWNTEVMWALDSYLAQADEQKKNDLIEALRNGSIAPNGMFANELTGLCNQQEMFRLFEAARNLQSENRIKVNSAMITDIPGWSWGVVPAMAGSGIKYFSAGTNPGHRIGDIVSELGDKPFYWISPSGEDSVLTWIHHSGYALFHTGLGGSVTTNLLTEAKVFPYLNWLAENEYPYDMTVLRYNIGSDNGPPDALLSKTVRDWNQAYSSPKLVISTVSEAFSLLEQKYGNQLPRLKGDLTGYWEDGAISSARETAINRDNATRAGQIETLYGILAERGYPENELDAIWRNILLFDEHTWGSWNSISEPGSPFTLQQWQTKKSFTEKAQQAIDEMMQHALKGRKSRDGELNAFEVINTCSWARSGYVYLSVDQVPSSKTLVDHSGKPIPMMAANERMNKYFVADVPAFGSVVYEIADKKSEGKRKPVEMNKQIDTKQFTLIFDHDNGSIKELYWKGSNGNMVDLSQGVGLNQYLYVKGRDPVAPVTARVSGIYQKYPEKVFIEMEAPGCKSLTSEIEVIDELSMVCITNILYKSKNYNPEAVHFAFPFKIDNGVMHYDLAFAGCIPEKDQLPGANRNFITIENYVDISNEDFGITWSSPDAPLIEVGEMMNDPISYGYVDHLDQSQTFYSYVMNNYWETNYLATQEGLVTFRYLIRFHDEFDAADAEKAGMDARTPFIVYPVDPGRKSIKPPFEVDNEDIIAFAVKPAFDGVVMSLMNCSDQSVTLKLKKLGDEVFLTDVDGRKRLPVEGTIEFPGYGIRHLFVKLKS